MESLSVTKDEYGRVVNTLKCELLSDGATACTCPRRGTSLPGCPHQGLPLRLPLLPPALRKQVLPPVPWHLRARTWVPASCWLQPPRLLPVLPQQHNRCPHAATRYDRRMLLLNKAACAVAVAGLCGTCSATESQPRG